MTGVRPAFRRMLLGLPRSPGDYAGVQTAAEFAELLGLDLVATFSEDADLSILAALPCVRELRPLGGGWRTIDPTVLQQELLDEGETARRLFGEVVRRRRNATAFSISRGSAGEALTTLARSDDILAVIEPRHPAGRISQQFTRLMTAACRAASSVMLVPGGARGHSGPIVAVVAGLHDPALPVARTIAAAVDAPLAAVSATGRALSLASPAGATPATRQADMIPLASAGRLPDLAAMLTGKKARLVLATRGAVGDAVLRALAPAQRIPALLIEPQAEPDAAPGKAN